MAYLSFTCSVGSCMCIATCISSLHARNAIAHGLHMRPHNAIHNAFVAPDNIQKRRRPIESRATENLTTCCIHLFRCASSCKRNINGRARGARTIENHWFRWFFLPWLLILLVFALFLLDFVFLLVFWFLALLRC